ncbi:MAG: hypothetical protein IAE77_01110 [Prosthecobacter sp.]|uniref:hypothetical protein n=1 Tax=Prosthecobacter sp. TaxID=1965333 RepID=UPI0019F83C86|nr:hypothetical protein [Prosthecobacter sp.]MBE2282039.1 hypothetical protein [Prosthecobacter sp.]
MPPFDDTKALIAGTIRTLAQLVPGVGGAVVQAWSEYEAHSQSKRIHEFFNQLADHLRGLEAQHQDLKSHVQKMPDVAELLERCVAAAKRETSDAKRRVFSMLYSQFISAPESTSPDERIDLIHHIEQLTDPDLTLLETFGRHRGAMRGDMITGTVTPGLTQASHQSHDSAWLTRHGSTVHSISKLIARGLLHDTVLTDSFFYHVDGPSSFDRFREKAWIITPMGRKLLNAIGVNMTK